MGNDLDDLRGVVGLAEVLTLTPKQRPATQLARSPLPAVLVKLRAERRQFACMVDEFDGVPDNVVVASRVEAR